MRKVIIILLAVFVLSSCFSPWEGDKPDSGSITVGIGSSAGGRSVEWAPDESTYKSWNHEIIVRSKNSSAIYEGEITPSASIFSLTFDNIPNGSYDVEVWARSPSAAGNDLMAVGRTSVTVAGSAINANVQMRPPVYIPPNQYAQNRYIYWDGEPFTAEIHPLIIENYDFLTMGLTNSGFAPMETHLPPFSSSNIPFSLSLVSASDYGDNIYIELLCIGYTNPLKSNVIKLWRPIDNSTIPSGLTLLNDYIVTDDLTLTLWAPKDLASSCTFDGNGKTISIDSFSIASILQIGLFGTNNGTIKNIKFNSDVSLSGSFSGFGTAAGMNNGTIENVSNMADIIIDTSSALCVGGIAGTNNGIIKNCYYDGDIDVTESVVSPFIQTGGIAGRNDNQILNCWASGSKVSINSLAFNNMGGIAGSSSDLIENCVALQTELELVTGSGDIARIATANGSLYSNNYVNEDMILNYNGSHAVAGPGPENDESTPLSSMGNVTWWMTSGVGWANASIDAWGGTEDKPWMWGSGRPVLWFEN